MFDSHESLDQLVEQALLLRGSALRDFLRKLKPSDRIAVQSALTADTDHDIGEGTEEADFKNGSVGSPSEIPGCANHLDERYRLIEIIGRGGMGEVWLAEQRRPTVRKVAIKFIGSIGTSPRALARFDVERQALAAMSHPSIATVFDSGQCPDRGPFFVMEYVRGLPITRFCDEGSLPLASRLWLMVELCRAVQHAHQKGVLHRDLKPDNILASHDDGSHRIKVIDFGLAKALHDHVHLGEKSVHTLSSSPIGTVDYMSPEQASASMRIDTRSDVYSLGVILYELLTGELPIKRKRKSISTGDGVETVWESDAEFQNAIVKSTPPRPSLRLSERGKLTSTLQDLGTDPTIRNSQSDRVTTENEAALAKWMGTLRKELDWIPMKCLEKEPERRYGGAGELADDIERYLRDEPILARPPSFGYRLRKAYRRNRIAFASTVAVAISLITGLLATTWLYHEATIATQDAESARTIAVASLAKQKQANEDRQLALDQASRNLDLAEKRGEQLIAEQKRTEDQLRRTEDELDRSRQFQANATLRNRNAYTALEVLQEIPKSRRGLMWNIQHHFVLRPDEMLVGHRGKVLDCMFHDSGRKLLSVAEDGTLRTWGLLERQQTSEIRLADELRLAKFHPSGRQVLVVLADGSWRILETDSGSKIGQGASNSPVTAIGFYATNNHNVKGSGSRNEWFFLGLENGSIEAYVRFDQSKGKAIVPWGYETISALKVHHDGNRILFATSDGNVHSHDLRSRQVETIRREPEESASNPVPMTISPLSSIDLVVNNGRWAEVYAFEDEDTRPNGSYGAEGTRAVGGWFSRMIWGDDRGSIFAKSLFAQENWALPPRFPGSTTTCIRINRDGSLAAVGEASGLIRVIDVRTANPNLARVRHAVSEDAERFAVRTISGRVIVRNLIDGSVQASFTPPKSRSPMIFSRSGKSLFMTTEDGWYSHDLVENRSQSQTSSKLRIGLDQVIAISENGSEIAAAGRDHRIYRWSLDTGEPKRTLIGHQTEIRTIAFARDGTTLMSGDSEGRVYQWNRDSGESETWSSIAGGVYRIAFDRRTNRVAISGSCDGTKSLCTTIKIYDVATRNELRNLGGDATGGLQFVDAKTICGLSDSGGLTLWDIESGKSWLSPSYQPPSTAIAKFGDRHCVFVTAHGHVIAVPANTQSNGTRVIFTDEEIADAGFTAHEKIVIEKKEGGWFQVEPGLARENWPAVPPPGENQVQASNQNWRMVPFYSSIMLQNKTQSDDRALKWARRFNERPDASWHRERAIACALSEDHATAIEHEAFVVNQLGGDSWRVFQKRLDSLLVHRSHRWGDVSELVKRLARSDDAQLTRAKMLNRDNFVMAQWDDDRGIVRLQGNAVVLDNKPKPTLVGLGDESGDSHQPDDSASEKFIRVIDRIAINAEVPTAEISVKDLAFTTLPTSEVKTRLEQTNRWIVGFVRGDDISLTHLPIADFSGLHPDTCFVALSSFADAGTIDQAMPPSKRSKSIPLTADR